MKKIVVSIILLIVIVLCCLLGYWQDDCILFQYNLMDVITVVAVSFGLFYFTQLNDDVRDKNNKIEDVISLIKDKLIKNYSNAILKENKSIYLSSIKYLQNKVSVLSALSKHLKCDTEITEISYEIEKLSDFINDNIESGDEYFAQPQFKNKIPNIIENIETRLDAIILKIYN